MRDDISSCLLSSRLFFYFRSTNKVQLSNWKFVVYCRLTTINVSLSLDQNRCRYPLIMYLS